MKLTYRAGACLMLVVSAMKFGCTVGGNAAVPAPSEAAMIDVRLTSPAPAYRIVGNLGRPFGEPVRIQGVIYQATNKLDSDVEMMKVWRIDGRLLDAPRLVRLSPRWSDWGEFSLPPKPQAGKWYEFAGYEDGAFVGRVSGMDSPMGITAGPNFHFRAWFQVVDGREIPEGAASD